MLTLFKLLLQVEVELFFQLDIGFQVSDLRRLIMNLYVLKLPLPLEIFDRLRFCSEFLPKLHDLTVLFVLELMILAKMVTALLFKTTYFV